MKIGIIGYGIVGKATEVMLRKYFNPKFDLVLYDPKIVDCNYEGMNSCGYVFICVPTPADPETGKCDTSIVEEAVSRLSAIKEKSFHIIIRSTVPPGTCEIFQEKYNYPIHFMPESLTESSWWEDAENPYYIITAGDYADQIMMLFKNFPKERKFIVDLPTASLFKYAMNCLFATKVTFAEAMFDVAQKCNANWPQIVDLMYRHPWVGSNHLEAWHRGKRGYDGKCLPKDVKAIAYGFDSSFLQFVDLYNKGVGYVKPD